MCATPMCVGCTRRGSYSAKGRVSAFRHLLSAFYKTLPSKDPSKNLPSKNPSKKHLLFENLLRTLLRSVLLHDPLGMPDLCVASSTSIPFWALVGRSLVAQDLMLVDGMRSPWFEQCR